MEDGTRLLPSTGTSMTTVLRIYSIPCSGKVSHGANFLAFRGWVGYRENTNSESLNVRTCTLCGLNAEKAQKLKPQKYLLEVILAKVQKFAPVKISRYTCVEPCRTCLL